MINILSLNEIENLVLQAAKKIDATPDLFPTYETIEGTARPAVKVDMFGYHYIISERGALIKHTQTYDINELLYWIFKDITSNMASNYELHHRDNDKDFRRIMFYKQIELLNQIHDNFGAMRQKEISEILQEHPYDDYASIRADLSKKYRDDGLSSKDAWEMACKQYPLPSK
jgi:hypothetical protein